MGNVPIQIVQLHVISFFNSPHSTKHAATADVIASTISCLLFLSARKIDCIGWTAVLAVVVAAAIPLQLINLQEI